MVYKEIEGITIGRVNGKDKPDLNVEDKKKSNVHPKLRNRRGLVDIGGELLHALFGGSTDHQVTDLEKKEEDQIKRLYAAAHYRS